MADRRHTVNVAVAGCCTGSRQEGSAPLASREALLTSWSGMDMTDITTEATEWFQQHWDPAMPLGDWWRLLADRASPSPVARGLRRCGLSGRDAKAVQEARRAVGAYGPPNGVATFLVAPTSSYGHARAAAALPPGHRRRHTRGASSSRNRRLALTWPRSAPRVKDGDEWTVTGQKVWNSGAHYAKYGILIARTDPDAPKHRGVTYFLIDMTQPGVDVRPLREMTGDAAFNEVFFDDARVHDSDRVGDEGDGWRIAMTTLSFERDPGNAGLGDTAAFYEADLTVPVGEHAEREAAADGFSSRERSPVSLRRSSRFRPEALVIRSSTSLGFTSTARSSG